MGKSASKDLIILSGNINKAPYISFYKKYYNISNILEWDRLGLVNKENKNVFRLSASEGKNQKFNRLVAYFKYKFFIYNHLK